MRLEISHDFFLAARLLSRVTQDFDASIGFQNGGFSMVLVRRGTGCVGNNEQLCARVCASEALEVVLCVFSQVMLYRVGLRLPHMAYVSHWCVEWRSSCLCLELPLECRLLSAHLRHPSLGMLLTGELAGD